MTIFKRRRYIYGSLFVILVVIIVISYPTQYNFSTDEPFIVATNYSAGPDDYRNMYDETIELNNDGSLVLYSTGNDDLVMGDDAPVLEVQLEDEQVEQMKETIKEERFWELPKDVGTPSEDGGFIYITVNLANKTKKVGGLNPDNERFHDVFQSVRDIVPDTDYNTWVEKIEEHIWENNSLIHDKKTDFNLDEPFFVLSMETTAENHSFVYQRNISIDLDGNLVLNAESREGDELDIGDDIPELTIQLTDNEMEELQDLVKKHFWKLSDVIINPDSNHKTESMTVHLKEEEKTVRGDDPIHPRFVAIRDFVVDLLAEKEYKSWEQEIEEKIWEKSVLNSESKTDYNMDEPFLTMDLKRYIGGNSLRPYYQRISIDMERNGVVYASENMLMGKDDDAPIMEFEATDTEYKEIKRLIEEHFWELDDRNYVPDGREDMETITLKLTNDTFEVEGNDPEDQNFNAIRRAMFELVDGEVYEEWEKEAEKYISESGPDFNSP